MYCTPWARLMKSITPNTSVSPAATRNNSTPSCSPLNSCTTNSAVDMGRSGLRMPSRCLSPGSIVPLTPELADSWISGTSPGMTPSFMWNRELFQLTLAGVGVALGLEDLLHDLCLELPVGTLGN